MAGNVPGHTCLWYPVATVGEEWSPTFKTKATPWGVAKPRGWPGPIPAGSTVLWACAVFKRCVKTVDAVEHFRLATAAAKKGKGIDSPTLPAWYPVEEREAFLTAGLPTGAEYTDEGCSVCGKVFGSREAGMKHLARHRG